MAITMLVVAVIVLAFDRKVFFRGIIYCFLYTTVFVRDEPCNAQRGGMLIPIIIKFNRGTTPCHRWETPYDASSSEQCINTDGSEFILTGL